MKSRSKALVIVAFLFLGLILTTFFSKCSSKTIEYKKSPPDTTQTFVNIVIPLQWQQFGIMPDQSVTTKAWRFTKDTFAFDTTHATTLTKKWKRDTIWIFEIHLPKKDTIGGKKDSTIYPFLTSIFILEDFNKNPNKP